MRKSSKRDIKISKKVNETGGQKRSYSKVDLRESACFFVICRKNMLKPIKNCQNKPKCTGYFVKKFG